MTKLSPKIEIINHYDNLINRVDIIDNCLGSYNEQFLNDNTRYIFHAPF